MVGVHNLGRKHGKNLVFEVFLHILLLVLLQFLEIQPADTVWIKLLLNLRIRLIPLFIKGRYSLKNLI